MIIDKGKSLSMLIQEKDQIIKSLIWQLTQKNNTISKLITVDKKTTKYKIDALESDNLLIHHKEKQLKYIILDVTHCKQFIYIDENVQIINPQTIFQYLDLPKQNKHEISKIEEECGYVLLEISKLKQQINNLHLNINKNTNLKTKKEQQQIHHQYKDQKHQIQSKLGDQQHHTQNDDSKLLHLDHRKKIKTIFIRN